MTYLRPESEWDTSMARVAVFIQNADTYAHWEMLESHLVELLTHQTGWQWALRDLHRCYEGLRDAGAISWAWGPDLDDAGRGTRIINIDDAGRLREIAKGALT